MTYRSILAAGAALITVTACSGNLTTDPSTSMYSKMDYQPELWPSRSGTPRLDPDIEDKISALMARMSTAEKVGQIIQPELRNVTPADVKTYHLGSILNGGGTTPNNDKQASLEDWVALAEAFYEASIDESDGKVAIPLIWGSDAVHGHNNLFGATIFPHNIGLGAARDPDLMERIGAATAVEMAASGLNWTFGPTVAVVRDVRWGRTYESYSETPSLVADYAERMVRGIQGEMAESNKYLPGKIAATAKHFLGDGGTTNGIDRGDTSISEQELLAVHAAGYISALDANVLTTMASFNSWNGYPMHGHKYLMTDVLKERMGFNGFIVGDWNGHRFIPGCTTEHCPDAINAGLDMFMVPEDWKALYKNTLKDVSKGRISMARLDDAVRRILRVKYLAGLFDAGPVRERMYVGEEKWVGHPDHRALAREAVRKSLVLLKNNDSVLPLQPNTKVLVAGKAADDIGQQSGGWTLTWQGTGNENADFPGATSILDGIRSRVEDAGGEVIFDPKGKMLADFKGEDSKPDVAIVVFGEEPYAEWHGDVSSIEYQYGNKKDLEMLKSLKQSGIPVVSVFITGRPLWTNKEINASDAFVVAWLPGSEGAGVADVLFTAADGQAKHDFVGKLPFSWPEQVTQASLNYGTEAYQPLFAYDYGLNYGDTITVADNLTEVSERMSSDELEEQWVFVSRVNAPWQIALYDSGQEPVVVNGNNASSAPDDNLVLASIDKVSQEDARRLKWSGIRPARVAFEAEYPQDLSVYHEHNAQIQFELKLDKVKSGALSLEMSCGDDCQSSVDIGAVADMSNKSWQTISIPLACMAGDSFDYSKVSQVFVLAGQAAASASIANIKIVPSEGEAKVNCGTAVAKL